MTEPSTSSALRRAFLRIEELEADAAARRGPLALVGMGCRFPGNADSPAALWELLAAGRDAIGEIPPDRWDISRFFDPRPGIPGKMYTTRGGFLDGVDRFDAAFFGISPREAAQLDPQQRLLLEVTWEALENAGIAPASLRGSRTGVYVGMATYDYAHLQMKSGDAAQYDAYFGTGTAASVASGRIAYTLGLRGPAISIDTACSSSLVALHLACRALRNGDCDLALVGGVNLILSPEAVISMCQSRMMAPDGRCKSFDAAADGFGQAEGCAVVAVKRLSDAERDGDRILALVRGTAINQDGASTGLTAPNGPAQEAVIRAALADAGLQPRDIGYVEAHGTGTTLGDPIEVQALAAVFGGDRAGDEPLWIGSIKSNLGHLEAAAGLAGLLKVALALRHREIPAHLNFNNPNPLIPWDSLAVRVADRLAPFAARGGRRVAGLSAFGFSGTNAHIILEEAPEAADVKKGGAERLLHLFTLGARNPHALRDLAGRYRRFLLENPDEALADVAWSANTGRSPAEYRLAVIACDAAELGAALVAFAAGEARPSLQTAVLEDLEPPRVAFLFPASAAANTEMVSKLLSTEPVFRAEFERCEALSAAPSFAMQWALLCLWRSWGIEPALVMGQGVGEYVAACASGVCSLEAAVTLARGGAGAAALSDPSLTMISGRTGQAVRKGEASRPEYWRRDAGGAARIQDGLRNAHGLGYRIFVELGGARTMAGDLGGECVFLTSLPEGGGDAWAGLLDTLARLYLRGVRVDWAAFDRPYPHRKLALPTYAFQRERYWVDARPSQPEPVRAAGAHPHLERRFDTALGNVFFEGHLDPARHPYLADHVVYGEIVLPAAFYLEVIAAAVREAMGGRDVVLQSVNIHRPIRLAGEGRDIQISVGSGRFQLFFREAEEWLPAVSGEYSGQPAEVRDRDGRGVCDEDVPVDAFYAACSRIGLEFGPSFRGLRSLRRCDNEAAGEIELPEAAGFAAGFGLHPAALDACLQTVAAAFPGFDPSLLETDVYMPVSVDRFALRSNARLPLTSRMRIDPGAGTETRTAHGIVEDADGAVVARIDGLHMKRAPKSAFARRGKPPLDECYYEVRWDVTPAPEAADFREGADLLVFADSRGLGDELRVRLEARGAACTMVYRADQCSESFAEMLDAPGHAFNGIVYLWPVEEVAGDDVAGQLENCCRPLLDLVQALGRQTGRPSPRLWVVTAGAEAIGPDDRIDGLPQTALSGLCKTIAIEHPEFQSARIDLDPRGSVDSLAAELAAPAGEPLVAYRNGCRYVPRLARIRGFASPEPLQLEIVERGTSAGVQLRPASRRQPAAGEVEIEVHAAGLNFRDVLNVLGVRKDDAPLGGEAAGVVTAIGDGVEGLKIGDEVVAITRGGLGTHAVAPCVLALRKPANLDFADAAASPLAFLTAHYALNVIGRMAKGERVLIHAAAGGVGMAAVQLARSAGLEIIATAGSAAKREFLRSIGIAHVFDSRSLAFAEEVRTATNGVGVDLVLNSLIGPAIAAGIGLLRAKGRFLEIGKAEIWTPDQAAAVNPLAHYHAIDLAENIALHPEAVRPMFVDLLGQLADGRLAPLPVKAFSLDAAGEAIEHMARARHIGKVVLLPPVAVRHADARLKADATYMISGGLTGLGLAAAERLVENGARNLLLFGRRAPLEEARGALDAMRARGANVVVSQADVSREEDVRALFEGPLHSMPPLRGVIHCAGRIEDGLLARQDWERFAQVLAPKTSGAWLLHRMTADCALDFFVLFSSAAALFGGPGQASYAAANTFLDGLAHYRRARGLPGQSINWGAWGVIGVAARRNIGERMTKQGVDELTPAEGLEALERLMDAGWTQAGVIRAEWPRVAAALNHPAEKNFLANLLPPGALADERLATGATVARELAEAAPEKRRGMLLKRVRAQVAAVIGLPNGQPIGEKQPLRDLGLDSLMAVELCTRLRMELGIEQALPSTVPFDYPSVAALTEYLAVEVFGWTVAPVPRGDRDLLGRIEQMSDEEVDRLLALQSTGVL